MTGIRIVMIGETGSGKSHLCKLLTRDAAIHVSHGTHSDTQTVNVHEGYGPDDNHYTVVDTPGFADCSQDSSPEHRSKIFSAITEELSNNGGLVLYLCKTSRFVGTAKTHHANHLEALRMLGISLPGDVVLVLTHVPNQLCMDPEQPMEKLSAAYMDWAVSQSLQIEDALGVRFAARLGLSNLPLPNEHPASSKMFASEMRPLLAKRLSPNSCISWLKVEEKLVRIVDMHTALMKKRHRVEQLKKAIKSADWYMAAAGLAAAIDIMILFPGGISAGLALYGGIQRMRTMPQLEQAKQMSRQQEKGLQADLDASTIPDTPEAMDVYIHRIRDLIHC